MAKIDRSRLTSYPPESFEDVVASSRLVRDYDDVKEWVVDTAPHLALSIRITWCPMTGKWWHKHHAIGNLAAARSYVRKHLRHIVEISLREAMAPYGWRWDGYDDYGNPVYARDNDSCGCSLRMTWDELQALAASVNQRKETYEHLLPEVA